MAGVHSVKKESVVDDSFPIAIIDFNFSLLTKEGCSINECSIYDYNRGTGQTFHILPTENLLRHVRQHDEQLKFNRRFFHSIPLEYGSTSFTSIVKLLNNVRENYSALLVKGGAKEDLLRDSLQYDNNIYNLERFGCPNLNQLQIKYSSVQQNFCIFHTPHYQGCSALKTLTLERWLTDNYQATRYYIKRENVEPDLISDY
jgi:hypothetical protein